ncbi:MAG: bacterial regulatory helix-turn-helix, lysR family protein [Burkholderia sp.]|jgi:DNA-binding transcriptional LysR family regulator|nr:bacterial regulatory helix-turn-helix, lysR family protein [Burkholderia sp.]
MSMNFDLADLRAFVAVAEMNSFRAAATALHLSQPAVSRRIEKLEAALGIRLFERTTRRIALTSVGRDFSHKARSLLDDLENSLLSMREVAASQMGEVVVACVPSAAYYFLPKVLAEYHKQYPRIRVRIVDDSANGVLASVTRGEADFGINITGNQEPDVDFQGILTEPFVVACRRDHPLGSKRSVSWAELAQFDYMTVDRSSGNRLLLDLALAHTNLNLAWCYEARHVSTLIGLVEAGLGVAVVPRLSMPVDGHSTLTSIALTDPGVERIVGLVRRRGRELTPSAQHLYQLIESTWPSHLK